MDAEKLALRRRINTLDEYATRLHAALTEAERENARLKAVLETVKRERDALRYDLLHLACDYIPACSICKHYTIDMKMCPHAEEIGAQDIDDCFEWRGLCAENGGIE